jgi:hypothetical protein
MRKRSFNPNRHFEDGPSIIVVPVALFAYALVVVGYLVMEAFAPRPRKK